ncbi:hypothetical protein BN6_67030 [Saccharothrix espanaensis DSM 44229]|uniref:EF-hand domain-containing protein n=1 Tax=Saccharothrix espanaensis (strain ATCC 51144 / DSM 44229 / JCM 9112 / NBRC 15066 / NRRL 15764) TaxID=1179773 RepID=K0K128_SACES|nr:hypothetical protein BN6_67030 [Saccharothrix espanaensis DSM 44229]
MRDSLEKSRAGSRILLLDCCFSASIIAGFTDKSLPDSVLADHDGRGYVVLTATDRWQPALEQSSRSLFTEALIEGLHDPEADVDQDGYLSASELYHYVHPGVRARAGHEPTFFASGVQGTVVVSKAAGGPAPRPAPRPTGGPRSTWTTCPRRRSTSASGRPSATCLTRWACSAVSGMWRSEPSRSIRPCCRRCARRWCRPTRYPDPQPLPRSGSVRWHALCSTTRSSVPTWLLSERLMRRWRGSWRSR